MLFNLTPEQLVHEEEDFPSNESEGEDAHYEEPTPPPSPPLKSSSNNNDNDEGNEQVELDVVASPLLHTPDLHRRRSVHSPTPRSPYLNSPSLRRSHVVSPRSKKPISASDDT